MGINTESIGQVVSKVGSHLSVEVRGMAYNTRDEFDEFELGEKIRVTFAGGTRKIIAIKQYKIGDKTIKETFDELAAWGDEPDDGEIECIYYDDETIWDEIE